MRNKKVAASLIVALFAVAVLAVTGKLWATPLFGLIPADDKAIERLANLTQIVGVLLAIPPLWVAWLAFAWPAW